MGLGRSKCQAAVLSNVRLDDRKDDLGFDHMTVISSLYPQPPQFEGAARPAKRSCIQPTVATAEVLITELCFSLG